MAVDVVENAVGATEWMRRWRTPASALALATFGAVGLLLRDPHQSHSWGICPVRAITGYACPGCGSLRGLRDLITGHPIEAVGHNLLLVPALAWLAWWWVRSAFLAAGCDIGGPPSSAKFCYSLLVVLTVFTVARNLPGSPLAP